MTGYKWSPKRIRDMKDFVPPSGSGDDGNAIRYSFSGEDYVVNIGDSGGGITPLDAPTDFVVAADYWLENQLTWTTPSGIDGIIIDRSEDGTVWQNNIARVTDNSGEYFDDYTNAPNPILWYRIRSFKLDTVEHYSDAVTATITDYSQLDSITLTTQDDYQRTKLTWDASGVQMINEYSSDGGATWNAWFRQSTDKQYYWFENGLGSFKLRVRVYGNDNYPNSNIVDFTAVTAPSVTAPTDMTATVNPSVQKVSVTWTNNESDFPVPWVGDGSDADGILLEQLNGDGFQINTYLIDPSLTSYDDYNVGAHGDYKYRIRVLRGGAYADSDDSNTVTVPVVQSFPGLPTSSSGLASGQLWNDGGTLKIA